tara:strand:- start:1726 stop:2001 length:276 start_codon:yes stop_codon:yes gene_type:complete
MEFLSQYDETKHIIEDEGFMPIEVLMDELNCLTADNHQLWYLYKQFNIKFFSDEEKIMIDNTIHKLIDKQRRINKANCDKLKATNLNEVLL